MSSVSVVVFRRLAALALTMAAMAGFLPSSPARAGELSYDDPAGDATELFEINAPRPSDAELDLLHLHWSTTADELVITTTLAAIGEPIASNGWAVAHYLDYEGTRFEILVQQVGTPSDLAFYDGVYLREAGDSSTEYPCVCRTYVEPGSSRMTVHVELHSLGSAARAINPRAKRPGPGTTFTSLATVSYRIAGVLLAADRAAPPPDSVLTV